ncbi:ankyrin repeat protein [Leptospira santarosai str. MOR084]|uniref:Ankyrin repeat protein n=1 Tax=Leptospira santarosai str. MOR084 TaxID=1049984 RepID=A0A0E2BEI3_9LEPT|nr:ankyrin repeat protein [Leptospira santarosai str. MOR084]
MKENKKSNAEKKSQTENLSVKTGSVPFWKRFLFFRAVQNGNAERVRSYLQNGLNPNRFRGMTPLSLAVKYERLEIVRILIEYLADPNLPDEKTDLTPLIHSIDASSTMISILIAPIRIKGTQTE